MSRAPSRPAPDEALPAIAVGGGPAGAAFALELARHGRPVILLERTRGPHHKVCGEFLSEEAQSILCSFGIDARTLGATPVARFRLARGQRQAMATLPFSAAGLSRMRLDEVLLGAAERAGAQVVRGARVTGILPEGEAIMVAGEGQTWRAAVVALATGKHALRGLGAPRGTMVGFKLHLRSRVAVQLLTDVVQLVFYRGGYVGACLVEDGTLSLAWVMQDRLLRVVGSSWDAQRSFLGGQSPFIANLLNAAEPLFAKPFATAAIPYGFLRSAAIASGIYPVGDQLGVVPSFTGDGMAIALYSGLAAARAVLKGQSAADYQRDLTAQLRRQFCLAWGVGRLLEVPALSPAMVLAARFAPALVSKLSAATRLTMSDEITAAVRRPRSGRVELAARE
jgi:flavin-dependent dehydrogenase